MRRGRLALALPLVLLAGGCKDSPLPVAVPDPEASAVLLSSHVAERSINMLDVCDPESFNAALGPGHCINRNGGMHFSTFIQLLQKHQTVESWRFTPTVINVKAGTTLPVLNVGGEVHTFTEVAEFGGGVEPILNLLSGNPVPTPECLAAAPGEFIPGGGQTSHTFGDAGEKKFMCCLHPWMRSVARVR